MRDIDIIKGVQFVGDDLISRAEDCSPIQKRSVKGYIAAAACLLLVIAAVPAVIARLNHNVVFSSSVERLDADEYGRTFYGTNRRFTEESYPAAEDFVNGTIILSPELRYLLKLPHEANDRFAVEARDANGSAGADEIYERFTVNYDDYGYAKNDRFTPTIYVTEEQIRSMEPLPDMCIYLEMTSRSFPHGTYLNEGNITEERFSKMYVEINLYYGVKEAAETLGFDLNEGCDSQAVYAELDRYFREFAADYGIDADNIFAGGIFCEQLSPVSSAWASMKFYGEFETSTIEKMLGDERVESIYKNHRGNYIYEERSGMYSNPTIVTKEQLIAIPANTSYGDIVETLGHTAQYGYDSLHVYLVGPAPETVQLYSGRMIILDFEDPNELCPYSGEEFLENAVSLQNLDTIRYASSDSRWHANAVVLKDDLALVFFRDRIKAVRLDLEDIEPENIIGHEPHYDENGEVNWFDQRRADKREIYRFGMQLAVRESGSLENLENSLDEICVPDLSCEWVAIIPQKLLIDICVSTDN